MNTCHKCTTYMHTYATTKTHHNNKHSAVKKIFLQQKNSPPEKTLEYNKNYPHIIHLV